MRTNNLNAVAYVILGLSIPCSSLLGATFTLSPLADAFVSSTNPANNYGGAGSFEISAAGLPKGEFQSLLQFDLSSAKANFDSVLGAGQWTLNSASLQLTAANPNNALFNSSAAGLIAIAWLQNDGWTEGAGTPTSPGATGITWNSLSTLFSAGDESVANFGFNGATSGNVAISLTTSAGVIADAAAGSLLSLRMSAPASESAVSALFNSRSFNTVASRPVLTLEAKLVPEPHSLILAVFGFGVIPFLRNERDSARHSH